MKKKIGSALYLLLGLVLLFFTIRTASIGLDPADRKIYERAMALDARTGGFGFPNFSVHNYTVRISNGRMDEVVRNDEWHREKAAVDTLVATALKIGDEYEVILPTYRDFSTFFDFLNGLATTAASGEQFTVDSYSEEFHIATLFHESFHAWQFSTMTAEGQEKMAHLMATGEDAEEIVTQEIDSVPKHRQSLQNELKYLYTADRAKDRGELVAALAKALDEESARRERLSEAAVSAERFYETVEGTARYVESKTYLALTDVESYRRAYLNEDAYSKGTEKYYRIGMMKALLLDRLALGWQKDFALPDDLSERLRAAM